MEVLPFFREKWEIGRRKLIKKWEARSWELIKNMGWKPEANLYGFHSPDGDDPNELLSPSICNLQKIEMGSV